MSSEKKRSPDAKKQSPAAKRSKNGGGEAPPLPPPPFPPTAAGTSSTAPPVLLQHPPNLLAAAPTAAGTSSTAPPVLLQRPPNLLAAAPTANNPFEPPVLRGAQFLIAAPRAPNPVHSNLPHRRRQQQISAPTAPNPPGRHILRPQRLQLQQVLNAAPTAPTAADSLRPQHLLMNNATIIAAGSEESENQLPTTPQPAGLAETTVTALIAIPPAGPLGATGGAPTPTGPEPTTTAAATAAAAAVPLNVVPARNVAPPPRGTSATRLNAVPARNVGPPPRGTSATRLNAVPVRNVAPPQVGAAGGARTPTGPEPTTTPAATTAVATAAAAAVPLNAVAALNVAPPAHGIPRTLNAFTARNTFRPPVLSLVQVGERFQQAQVSFTHKRLAATLELEQGVDQRQSREQFIVRFSVINVVSAWEAGFNNLVGAFFKRFGGEPEQRQGLNSAGEKWDEYRSKAPTFNHLVFAVLRVGLLVSHPETHRQGGYTFRFI